MPLIRDGKLLEDDWVHVSDDDELPPSQPVIISLARWRAERDRLKGRNAPLGVRLASNEPAEAIAEDVGYFQVVALEFPAFRDGRAYSTARLLRERYGYTGELRAVGNVLRDQYLFMHRCGFDAFEVADDAGVDAWTEAIAEFSVFYQPASDGRTPATLLRRYGRAAE